jgi:anti-sigma factor RsiW
MSESTDERTEHQEIEDLFSGFYEGDLEADDKKRVEAHLEGCEQCEAEYQDFIKAVDQISGLGKRKMAAPPGFEKDVESVIERRSAGRFFSGRKLTDRTPLTILALVAIAIGAGLYWWLRSSETGSLKTNPDPPADVEPGVRDVLPSP